MLIDLRIKTAFF